jgi:hypothetical protein
MVVWFRLGNNEDEASKQGQRQALLSDKMGLGHRTEVSLYLRFHYGTPLMRLATCFIIGNRP